MVFANDGSFVVVGEPLCVDEEFMAGEYVKPSKSGVITSMVTGIVSYDHGKRVVTVKPIRAAQTISVGDEVIAQVREVQGKIAPALILSVNGSVLKHPRMAVIIPKPGKMRGEMKEYVGVRDLVLASVVTNFMGVLGLSIWAPKLGVLLGVCDTCSGILIKSHRGGLICPRCDTEQKRKIAPKYSDTDYLVSALR